MDPSPQVSTDVLLRLAAQGDQGAWRGLVSGYSARVYGLLIRQCGDPELAEELTQSTFVQVVTHIGGYQESGKFEPWLFRIAMNRLRDEMRRRQRHAKPMAPGRGEGDGAGGGERGAGEGGGTWEAVEREVAERYEEGAESPLAKLAEAEQAEQVRVAVGRLNEADREIILMRHTAGLSFAQIAESLDQPLGTVLARGHRALAKLRVMLTKLDGDADTEPKMPRKQAGS